jgi:type III secretion protein T
MTIPWSAKGMGAEGMEALRAALTALALGAPRLLGLHLALPMFGPQTMPGMVRNSFLFSLSLFLVPLLMRQVPAAPLPPLHQAGLVLKEVALGFLLGYLVGLLLHAAQAAGDLIAFQSGAGMSAFFDPSAQEETTPMGLLLRQFIIALFFAGGGYLLLLGAVLDGYRFWPVFDFVPKVDAQAAALAARAAGGYLAAACLFAFPVVFCMFLVTFGLGLVSRFVPALNVFVLAMPVQALAAVLVMAACLGVLAGVFRDRILDIGPWLESARAVLSP